MDQQTVELVKSFVPVLQAHGREITTRFYATMFDDYPALLNIFNHSNQREGLQQQALATAVYAAAANIDNLSAILPAVLHIAHKHCSLGVQSDHYSIVGIYLTRAIQDVLGDAVTPELLAAWQTAYAQISDAFIQLEHAMYQEQEQRRGGWVGFRPFVVEHVHRVAEDIIAVDLVAEDGQPIVEDYAAGQYVTVKISQGGYTHLRQYSLCDAPGHNRYRIAIKYENTSSDAQHPGLVSSFLHTSVQSGATLLVSAPYGVFTFDSTRRNPVVFLAGGIGLTPLLSMVHTVAEQQPARQAQLVYAVRDARYHAFADDLNALAERTPSLTNTVFYESGSEQDVEQQRCTNLGRIGESWLQQHVPQDAEVYVCGPRIFMQAMISHLLRQGIPMEQIHYEVFGPALSFSVA